MPRMAEKSHAEEELASLGEELRREREMRGVSLREISDATKVSIRYLEGLEKGDSKALPAAVFVRGFVREFARYLGLDAEEMVDRYLRTVTDLENERAVRIRQANPQLKEYDPTRDEGRLRTIFRILGFLIVVGVLAALGYYFRDDLLSLRRFLPGESGTESDRAVTPPAAAPATETGQEAAEATSTDPPLPEVEPLFMKIEFLEPTWIHLLVDGESALHTTVNTGVVREFRARERIEIRTLGNAGGVLVTIDDREIGTLGASREVIKGRVFENPRARTTPTG